MQRYEKCEYVYRIPKDQTGTQCNQPVIHPLIPFCGGCWVDFDVHRYLNSKRIEYQAKIQAYNTWANSLFWSTLALKRLGLPKELRRIINKINQPYPYALYLDYVEFTRAIFSI